MKVPMMYSMLMRALHEHPAREQYELLADQGFRNEHIADVIASKGDGMLTLTDGRMTYRVQNNPGRLAWLAERVARCYGWTGKRTPRPRPYVPVGRSFPKFVPGKTTTAGYVRDFYKLNGGHDWHDMRAPNTPAPYERPEVEEQMQEAA
jgi:hypothetical protein